MAVSRTTVSVEGSTGRDGTIRVPLTLARMFATEGEEIEIVLFSDGHLEMDVPGGRCDPPSPDPAGRIQMSTEEFLRMLESEHDA